MSKYNREKIKGIIIAFIYANVLLLFLGGKGNSFKPLLKLYSKHPIKAIIISLLITTAAFLFYIYIWEPFKKWFEKTWS